MKCFLIPALSLAALAATGLTLIAAKAPAPAPAHAWTPAVAAPAAVAATYTIDKVHSSLIFSLTHMKTSRSYGRFNDFSGTVSFDDAKPEASKVSIQIQVASVDTNSKDRDEHLRGPDFFEVKEYPVAKFESKTIEKTGDKTWSVKGTLDLHGVKKDVTIAMEQTGSGKGFTGESLIGFHGTTSISRSDFGVKYGPEVLGDKVDLTISIEAAAK